MIDDVIELPRPLSSKRGRAVLASYAPFEIPDSPLGNYFGVGDFMNRDMPICIGNEFELITGTDAPHRFKFIEHNDKEIIEYIAIANGPIKNLTTKTWTLWINHVDRKSLVVKREYCWDNIISAREYFGFKPVDVLSKKVKDEVEGTAGAIYPGLARLYKWTHEPGSVFVAPNDEDKEVERLMLMRQNIRSFNNAWDMEYMPLAEDLFRGCGKHDSEKKLRLFSASGRTIPTVPLLMKEVMRFAAPYVNQGLYHHCMNPKIKSWIDQACIDGLTEFSGWFEVLKYIEHIPYGEVYLQLTQKSEDVVRIYDPYDNGVYFDIDSHKLSVARAKDPEAHDAEHKLDEAACIIRDSVADLIGSFKQMSVYRSWSEEVYITIQKKNGTTSRFYFDMFHAVLGSRLLEEHSETAE